MSEGCGTCNVCSGDYFMVEFEGACCSTILEYNGEPIMDIDTAIWSVLRDHPGKSWRVFNSTESYYHNWEGEKV